jgi:hypothetical protein
LKMKKIILAIAVATTMLAGQAQAHGYYGGGYGYRGGCYNCGGGWVGPAVAGLAIGAVIGAATQPVYVPQPQVIYQQQPQVIYQQEYRTPPQYSPQYLPPVSCVPAYTAQGQYLGCIR